jgi:transglutaminase-like putative cysteine protease
MHLSARRALQAAAVLLGLFVSAALVTWPFLRERSALGTSYSTSIVHRPSLPVDAYELLSGRSLFRSIAQRVTAGKSTQAERISALMEWTHENVRPQYAAPNRVIPDGFLDIVRRGHGYCDQTAHVFATLAHYAGYDARLLFLRAPDGVSPHTVAEVRVSDSWILVDPWLGQVLLDRRGNLAGVDALGVSADLPEGYATLASHLDEGYFRRATTFETFPYLPLTDLFAKVWRRGTGSRGSDPPPGPRTTVAALDTHVDASGPQRPRDRRARGQRRGRARAPAAAADDDIRLMDSARRAHLDARFDEAITHYRALLLRPLPRDMADAVRFFLGLAVLRNGAAPEAIVAFDSALEEAPDSPWLPSVLFYRAEAKLLAGDSEGAVADLRESGIPKAQARLVELGEAR